jgi:hypothetical protein
VTPPDTRKETSKKPVLADKKAINMLIEKAIALSPFKMT